MSPDRRDRGLHGKPRAGRIGEERRNACTRNLFRFLCFFPVAVVAVIAGGGIAWADETIKLTTAFSEILRHDRPAHTIAIDNPEVADANVGNDRMIVPTAKAAGVTDMIVVDEAGGKISSAMLRVSRTSQSHRERGPPVIRRCNDSWSTSEYGCAPQREPAGTRPSAAAPRRGLGDRSGSGSTPSASVHPGAPEPNRSGGTSP